MIIIIKKFELLHFFKFDLQSKQKFNILVFIVLVTFHFFINTFIKCVRETFQFN